MYQELTLVGLLVVPLIIIVDSTIRIYKYILLVHYYNHTTVTVNPYTLLPVVLHCAVLFLLSLLFTSFIFIMLA